MSERQDKTGMLAFEMNGVCYMAQVEVPAALAMELVADCMQPMWIGVDVGTEDLTAIRGAAGHLTIMKGGEA